MFSLEELLGLWDQRLIDVEILRNHLGPGLDDLEQALASLPAASSLNPVPTQDLEALRSRVENLLDGLSDFYEQPEAIAQADLQGLQGQLADARQRTEDLEAWLDWNVGLSGLCLCG